MRTAAARLNRPELRDTALILGLAGASWLLGNGALMHALQRSGPDHVAVNQLVWLASAAVGLAALAGRRRFPLTVVGITLAVTVLHMDGGFPPVAADLCVPVALYAVATTSRTVAARAALVLALATAAGWSIYLAVRSGHAAGALSFPTSLAPKAISAARAYGALVQAQVQQPAAWECGRAAWAALLALCFC